MKKLTTKLALKKILGGDLTEQERRFIIEMDIRQKIKRSREQNGLPLTLVARAIKDGIGDDLWALVDILNKEKDLWILNSKN